MIGKATKSYAQYLLDNQQDVSYTIKSGNQRQGSSFESVWIRHTNLTGKIGEVHPEANEGFPLTQAQKRDFIYNLIKNNDPIFVPILQHPENAAALAKWVGIPELHIPGADSRNKQLAEIQTMIRNSQGLEDQALQQTTVPVQGSDDHAIEVATIRAYLATPAGLDLYEHNNAAYTDIQAHMMEHLEYVNQMNAEGVQEEEVPQQQGV